MRMLLLVLLAALVLTGPLLSIRLFRQDWLALYETFRPRIDSPFFKVGFARVLRAFLTGFNEMLKVRLNLPEAKRKLDESFPVFDRGFAYEGAGMGLGLRMTFAWWERASFEELYNRLDGGYLYQYYVGLGWWLHQKNRFRPRGTMRAVNKLHPLYRPIVFDGIGFKAGMFDYRDKPEQTVRAFYNYPAPYQRGCFQGLGRSLWFLAEFEPDVLLQLAERIEPHDQQDLFSGIGLAVAYSMANNLDLQFKVLDLIPSDRQAAFYQGLAFGWEARRLQNPAYWQRILEEATEGRKLFLKKALRDVEEVKAQLTPETDAEAYFRWLEGVRARYESEKQEGVETHAN